ncbi:MBL fold metallo-hydrolase [Bradyrhizobium sp. 6(2017)]|uniref:MBL fold metallo-hydrolase n=1 Tax=Bradyrhizobium sp. 6(2017) TaxID=1197460 RepID=UPI0013E1D6B1|nr:MBL fold metallo-hydrolase [Bradyrhizobium sp. 6(2017)]QIG97671.1 MBL fold metallo-hydrolase [Bradyrhizobium sp. 6(2017)]
MFRPKNGEISRRTVLGSAATAVLASTFDSAPAQALAPLSKAAGPFFQKFRLGEIVITVVSDGLIFGGDPKKTFTGATPEEISTLLSGSFLETSKLAFDENVVLVNTGSKLVLFDTGSGPVKDFGPDAGKLFENLKAAGVNPADIDAVVLTHGHADHICGVVRDGRIMFDNAHFYINQVEYDFWLDPAKAGTPLKLFHQQAVLNLLPIRDRLSFIRDGQEVVPGVQAILAPGHTPGQMAFMITSGAKSLALIADVARHHILNVETPRLEFVGDIDPRQCVDTRIRLFEMLIQNRTPLLSYHYPFPGVGHLAKWGDRYRYYPAGLLQGI